MMFNAPSVQGSQAAEGRYQLGKQLAVGGMGIIHEAFDTLAKRQVAYKRLKVSNEKARARLTALFEGEYNALRQLKHPNIVEVYDYGRDSEGPFYTMELLAGSDLAGIGPLPLVDACRALRDVASALALLHARRLVHRDVTPANVRMTPDGRAKLIDFGALSEFGIAKDIVGTASYVAPECLAGEPLDGRADLFALGALCYWVLTRRPAYPARNMSEVLDAWKVPVVPPSEYAPELPKELDQLVLALLERDPTARLASAAHVIERLTAIASLPPQEDQCELAHSYLLHPPLVGREAVLSRLTQLATEASAGRGQTAMIEAGAGLGRSALLDRIAIDGQLSGAYVLRFQPSGQRDEGVAAALLRWMRAHFPDLSQELSARHPVLARDARAPLEAVLSAADVTMQRARLVTAVQACVQAISERAALTILVDDVQHADPESLAVLASLARASARLHLLLVLTLHEGAQGSDPNALTDLRAAATALPLCLLSEHDLEILLEAVFGKVPNTLRLARFLKAQSGGNPGQCMDLCRLLLDRDEIRYALGTFVLPFDPRADGLSGSALELTRLSGLSSSARALVGLLSLHDGALKTAAAADALGCAEETLVASAEELGSRSLVQRYEDALALSSQSLRSAIAESIERETRSELHAALARTILAHEEPTVENRFAACHQLLRAGRDDAAIELVWAELRDTQLDNGSIARIAPVLEALLGVLRARGHRDELCWPVLWPLLVAGFWGELGALNRHRDATLNALANVTGMALARRLRTILGKRLSLVIGFAYGVLRFLTTPRRFRAPTYPYLMQRFFSAVTMSTATASVSFEPATALRTVGLLDPIEAMKEGTPAHIAREFALATAELGIGITQRAAQRYQRLIELLSANDDPTFVVMREAFLDGCYHGCAQAEVSAGGPNTLHMAEELSRRHPFFQPHVETIRMTYYGARGERERAREHRRKAELLALQGGMSWSAFTVLTFRNAYIAMACQDTLGVIEAGVELERLASFAPNMRVYRDLCQAYVALSRGRAQEALAIYERCAALPDAHLLPAYDLFVSQHAEALVELARLDEAKQVCEAGLDARRALGIPSYALRNLRQTLALIEGRAGKYARAKELLNEVESEVLISESPLAIGSLHRDRARVALLERNADDFGRAFESMLSAYRPTRNPSLLQQCRKLLAEGEQLGLTAAPSWKQFDFATFSTTQVVATTAPEVTELI